MGKLLEGQHALVTGGNSGVGKGIALELAAAGCNVIVNFLDDEECRADIRRDRDAWG